MCSKDLHIYLKCENFTTYFNDYYDQYHEYTVITIFFYFKLSTDFFFFTKRHNVCFARVFF